VAEYRPRSRGDLERCRATRRGGPRISQDRGPRTRRAVPGGRVSAVTRPHPDLDAVLFDMDGLLVDTEDAWGTAEAKVMAELGGPPWTDDEVATFVGGPISRVGEYMVAKAGSDRSPEAVADRLVEVMA